ncbi:uncharacterized protein LOC141529980 [Cotesia typhae]|uniref:uncharacterized protein LOC141529980 n=1 Tax=Cotesia typhae TaxID=2053667 RepID=UPI003D68D506
MQDPASLTRDRSDERIGFIANIKTKYDDDEIGVKKLEKQLDFEKRKLESEKEKSLFDKNVELLSSQGSAQSVSSGEVYIPTTAGQFKSRNIRGTHNILNERVVATFDRCKVSDRDAVFITTAICQSLIDLKLLEVDINSIIVNRSSIRRCRLTMRESKSIEIKKHFQDLKLSSIVVHWDRKLLPNLLNTETVHRLPVIITSESNEIMLGVPTSEDGTGMAQASVVHKTLCDWEFDISVKAICCDTTPSNLGRRNGAAALLEKFNAAAPLRRPKFEGVVSQHIAFTDMSNSQSHNVL